MDLDEYGTLGFNLTNIRFPIQEMSISSDQRMVTLTDQGAIVNLHDYNSRILFDYEYCSTPTFFADTGEFELDLQNLSLMLDLKSNYQHGS